MTIPILPPFSGSGFGIQPLPDIVPFTNRSGATFAELFYEYRNYIENEIVKGLNGDKETLVAALNAYIETLAPGQDGKDGENGKDGKDGEDGPPGPAGPQGPSTPEIDIVNAANKTFAPALFAELSAFRETRPVPIVIAGSSVAAQTTSDRWVTQFNKRVQTAYPLANGAQEQVIKTLAQVVATPLTGKGAVVVNAAIGGTNTSNFLTATTRAQVMATNPAAVIIADLPANDVPAKITPGNVEANMTSQLGDLIAKRNPLYPCNFIVVGGYYPSVEGIATPDEYRAAMRRAVAKFPGNAYWFDTYDAWVTLGVGNFMPDPRGLLLADKLHPNAYGHKALADMVARLFSLPDGYGGNVTVVAPTITTSSLNSMTVGQAFSQQVSYTGTTDPLFTISVGSLPPGIVISSTGLISGTPTTANNYTFTVKAANSAGSSEKQFNVTVSSTATAPVITTATLGQLTVGSPVNIPILFTGSTPATFTITAGALPAGLSMGNDGVVSGTPSTEGAYNVTVRATNSAGNNSRVYSDVVAAQPLVVTLLGSDAFAVDGTLNGRKIVNGNGDTLATFGVQGSAWTIANGVLKASTASGVSAGLIDTGRSEGVRVTSRFVSHSSGVGQFIEILRTGTSNAFQFGIGANGKLALVNSTSGILQELTTVPADIVGKTLGVQYFEGKLAGFVDGVKVAEVSVTPGGGTYAGYSKSSTASNMTWDDFAYYAVSR